MGILCDFLVADEATAATYDGMEIDEADVVHLKGLTSLQAAQMWAVLCDQEYSVELLGDFELISPEEGECWTQRVPSDMVERLAGIDESDIAEFAERFAEATLEEMGWSAEDFAPVVRDLAALARRAGTTGRSMFLWNAL